MKYLSICSGIEAASVAWGPLGFTPVAFSEIEPFPSAVLNHHYPSVPNAGDFTSIKGNEYGKFDILVGGTPCQSFSVAGKRGGLSDERGNLALEYIKLAYRSRPEFIVWENVPGVFSSGHGNDFRCFLHGLTGVDVPVPQKGWKNSGLIVGLPGHYSVAWRVLDAQFTGVPQRRRRVFVVGHLGDWRRAAAVLFERESLLWNPAPSREARKDVASRSGERTTASGKPTFGTLMANIGTKLWLGNQEALSGDFHILEPIPISYGIRTANTSSNGCGIQEEVTHTLDRAQGIAVAYGFSAGQSKDAGTIAWQPEQSPTLRGASSGTNQVPAVALCDMGQVAVMRMREGCDGGGKGSLISNNLSLTLATSNDQVIIRCLSVRRLTPIECERLQGFPDNYTLVPYRGKPPADGPRYKALGNSMAVPVMRWIGERIQMYSRRSIPA